MEWVNTEQDREFGLTQSCPILLFSAIPFELQGRVGMQSVPYSIKCHPCLVMLAAHSLLLPGISKVML
jgi:hypothetical protein